MMKPRGAKDLNSNSYESGVKETMDWIPINEFDKHKAYSAFMKDYLKSKHNGIEHIVTDKRTLF